MVDHNSLEDLLENIIHRSKHHPSILAINKEKLENIFEFHYVDQEEVTNEIKKLDPKKTTTRNRGDFLRIGQEKGRGQMFCLL